MKIKAISSRVFSAMRLRSHTMGFTAEAIAGLDIALWDLLGKYRQEPVWRLLGGAYRQTLPVYSAGIPGDTSEKQVQQLEGILARGFTTAKCGSGNPTLQMQMDLLTHILLSLFFLLLMIPA